MYEFTDEANEFARQYARKRRMGPITAEYDLEVSAYPTTEAERSNRLARMRAQYGYAPSRTATQPSRPVRSLPRSSRSRVESTSGRPGAFTRGPGHPTPRVLAAAIDGDGTGARVCGHSDCKTININHEGPAPEFCQVHQ